MSAVRALGSRYALERVLGTGAMGQVWLAVDQRTGERVAAKLLRSEYTRDAGIIGRFVQERAILVDLDHPNVVRVRDLVVEGDDLAIVMDLVEGTDLRGRLRERETLPAGEAVRVAADVLDALAEAHGRGILHRDVKPDNVLLDASHDPARVLLSDFSIARLAQETTVRMTGVLGTAEYIAPEVFTAEVVSAAADVYGTGVLLYELLAGRTPFAGGGTGYAVANRHVTAHPPELPGLPQALVAPLNAMLQKDPRRRPTAAAAAAALRAAAPELAGIAALPVQPVPERWVPVDAAAAAPPLSVAGHRPSADVVLDPGLTNVKATRPPVQPLPAPEVASSGGWRAPLPAVDEEVLGQQTQLRTPVAPRPTEQDLLPEPETAPPSRRWHRDPRVLAAAAGAAGLAVLAAVLLRGGDEAPAMPQPQAAPQQPQLLTVTAPPDVTAAGLTTVREASYDPEAERLTTTVTWTAGSSGLAGPLFEPVPAASTGEVCPDVVWAVTALRDTTPGVDAAACGWQVQLDRLPAGGSSSVEYSLSFALPDDADASAAVRERLRDQVAATGDALEGVRESAVYAAQRLQALAVQVDGLVRVGAPVDLVVLPLWRGAAAPSQVDVLYSSRSPQPTQLLQQLGGELDLSTEDCSGSVAFKGGVPYANTVARGCTITARVGALEGRSRQFDVGQNSTG